MRRLVVTIGLALGALAGCSAAPDPGPLFDHEAGQPIECLAHQTGEPGARYTNRELRNTGEVFAMMRYYTAHGTKPFCDGAPATDADRAWAQTYLQLGGTTDKVTSVLS